MKQNSSLSKKANLGSAIYGNPVTLIEVSDTKHDFDNYMDASDFLGLHYQMVKNYLQTRIKIIKSKKNGKLYLIKKVSQP